MIFGSQNFLLRAVLVSAESLISRISPRKRIFQQIHFSLLIRGPGGFDSWKNVNTWHCHFKWCILRMLRWRKRWWPPWILAWGSAVMLTLLRSVPRSPDIFYIYSKLYRKEMIPLRIYCTYLYFEPVLWIQIQIWSVFGNVGGAF